MDPDKLPLRDIHLPEPIGLWPLAYGWWLLLAVCVIVAIIALLLWRRWQRRRPLRQALAAVDAAALLHQQGKPDEALQLVSETLRRMAMTSTVDEVAGLTGQAWLVWLDSRWSREGFQSGAGKLLIDAPYKPPGGIDSEAANDVIELARSWLQAQQLGATGHG